MFSSSKELPGGSSLDSRPDHVYLLVFPIFAMIGGSSARGDFQEGAHTPGKKYCRQNRRLSRPNWGWDLAHRDAGPAVSGSVT